jgi:5-methylthioadenosine/S-adenosylhomocysteine deaminase
MWEKEIGSLELGKKADILLIDIKKPYFMPVVDIPKTNIISNLINAGSGNDVHTVIVDGKTIVKDRLVQTLNEEDVMVQFQKSAEDLMNRSKYKVQKGLLGWPIE